MANHFDLVSALEESFMLYLFEFTSYVVLFRTKISKIRQEETNFRTNLYSKSPEAKKLSVLGPDLSFFVKKVCK